MSKPTETWTLEEYRAFIASGGTARPLFPHPSKALPPDATKPPEKSRLAVQFENMWDAMENAPRYAVEVQVHPDRQFRYDYAWPAERVALELQGGIYLPLKEGRTGGHGAPKKFRSDCDKLNLSNLQGVVLFKLATGQITIENLVMIRDYILQRRNQQHTQP